MFVRIALSSLPALAVVWVPRTQKSLPLSVCSSRWRPVIEIWAEDVLRFAGGAPFRSAANAPRLAPVSGVALADIGVACLACTRVRVRVARSACRAPPPAGSRAGLLDKLENPFYYTII